MKKTLLILSMLPALALIAHSQTVNLGDFEDGNMGLWDSWGAPTGIVFNPAADATNASDSVAILDQSGGAWNGFRLWSDDPVLMGGYDKLSVDVWLNADGLIQIFMDNTVSSGAADYTAQVTGITAGAWTTIEFDLMGLPARDYKQIAFQYDVADTVYFDNITLHVKPLADTNDFTAETIVFGTVDSPEDFTGEFSLSWDEDSIYLFLDITDDSIVNTGAAWQCDNIEVYYDMDNSKNVKWPRNGTWIANPDPSYDDNDWQARLVPDVDYAVNNTARPSPVTGAKQAYVETESGYQFNLHIALDSLMPGFNRSLGRRIGFDLLISDNDDAAAVNDANRNQITFVSPTDKPFNDPSLFATLQLGADEKFSLIPDTIDPTTPPDLAGDPVNDVVTLSWGQSTDNIAIMKYLVYQDDVMVDEAYAVEDGANMLKVTELAEGDYTFGVVAVDNHDNESEMTTVDVTVVHVPELIFSPSTREISAYPNPTSGDLYIAGVEDIISVEIIGLSGSVVKTVTDVSVINVSELTNGMYFLRVYSDTGVFTGRFLKN